MVITSNFRAFVMTECSDSEPMNLCFRWDSALPVVVDLVFPQGPILEWVMSRDDLAVGLRAGGDLSIKKYTGYTCIKLTNPTGTGWVNIRQSDVDLFLDRTYAVVPREHTGSILQAWLIADLAL